MLVAEVLVLVVGGGAVDFGDDDALDAFKLPGQVVPGGGKALAVAAPGGEELHEGNAGLGRSLRRRQEVKMRQVRMLSSSTSQLPTEERGFSTVVRARLHKQPKMFGGNVWRILLLFWRDRSRIFLITVRKTSNGNAGKLLSPRMSPCPAF